MASRKCAAGMQLTTKGGVTNLRISYRGDGGRPADVGYQEQVSNHLKWLLLRATVVSIKEKSSLTRQVGIRKTNKTEPLLTRRKAENGIKTGAFAILQDKVYELT